MSTAAREYHLIDLVGTSYGGFQTLAGARQVAREEACERGTSSMETIGSNTTIPMTGRGQT